MGPPKELSPSFRNTRKTSSGERMCEVLRTANRAAIAIEEHCAHEAARGRSRILEKGHESEVHVQLLVTVKQRQSRIVSDKIKSQLLKAPQHHDVFDHP